ncbi:MAG: DUF177 domain-containing protein [Proteobacteria bacterium]|nr:MAG: DUF177 domain-containing protein [Pseudomonadota bacterium]
MKIRLNEIPAEGRKYNFDRQTGELNASLSDVIGNRDYSVEFFISPIGNAYEMRGRLKTTVDEVCSRCGYEIELPIDRAISEILFEEDQEYRKQESASGNHSVDFLSDGPSMIPVRGNVLDPEEYTHEAIALSIPSYPTCKPNGECEHFDEVSQVIQRLEQESNLENEKKPVGHPAFSALQGLSLPSNDKDSKN